MTYIDCKHYATSVAPAKQFSRSTRQCYRPNARRWLRPDTKNEMTQMTQSVLFRCGYATKLKCLYCRSTFLFFLTSSQTSNSTQRSDNLDLANSTFSTNIWGRLPPSPHGYGPVTVWDKETLRDTDINHMWPQLFVTARPAPKLLACFAVRFHSRGNDGCATRGADAHHLCLHLRKEVRLSLSVAN